jgi:hypothetical protein
MPTASLAVCFQGQDGGHTLALSFSAFDPEAEMSGSPLLLRKLAIESHSFARISLL